ncbi:Uncharacterized protein QTN25_006794 [Entamoeba marina]
MEYICYDYEIKHFFLPPENPSELNEVLQGGCVIYETMHVIMGESLSSLRLQSGSTTIESSYRTLHGGLLLAVGGSKLLEVGGTKNLSNDLLECIASSLIMRYGCYASLKPTIPANSDAETQIKLPLSNPNFISVIHSIGKHIANCSSLLYMDYSMYNTRVPYQPPPIAAFTLAMRYITSRVVNNGILGSAIYLNDNDNDNEKNKYFVTIASTFPPSIDPIARLVSLALYKEIQRKTIVSDIYLTSNQLKDLTASAGFVGKEKLESIMVSLNECPIICEKCQLRKVKIIASVVSTFIKVEILCFDVTNDYLERFESDDISGMEGLGSFIKNETKRGEINKLRIDFATSMVEPVQLFQTKVNEQLTKCIHLEKSKELVGGDKVMVATKNPNDECFLCSTFNSEMTAMKTKLDDVDKRAL